jgi:hypothetical protein
MAGLKGKKKNRKHRRQKAIGRKPPIKTKNSGKKNDNMIKYFRRNEEEFL